MLRRPIERKSKTYAGTLPSSNPKFLPGLRTPMFDRSRGENSTPILSTEGETVIQSNDDLARHLRVERDVYSRALELYRTGRMKFVANNIDITTYQMNDL